MGFSWGVSARAQTITTSKGAYLPEETIVANFGNASGNSQDWIGLYAAGAPNTDYLDWLRTDGTQTGTGGIINGSVSFPSGLPSPGNYEARLFNGNASFTLEAQVAFSVRSGLQASNPNPASDSTGVGLNPTLTWTAGDEAVEHEVYFGTNPNPGAAELQSNQIETSYTPAGPLTVQTTYYWRIDEVNGGGTTTGVVWSFTTAASSSTPTIALSKGAYLPGETIVVSFGNAAGDSDDWIGLHAALAPNTDYLDWLRTDGTQAGTAGIIDGSVSFPSGLPNPGNYEARFFFFGSFTLEAHAAFSVQSVQSEPPAQASNPNPASDSTEVGLNPTLTWTAGDGATSHEVYFGTNPNPGAAELKGNQSETSYTPPGPLTVNTTYHWRIDEVNAQGTTTGVVWNFTPTPELQLQTAASWKTHDQNGGTGNFSINLPLSGAPAVESRNGGGNYTLVFTFNNDVVSGNASVTSSLGPGNGSVSGTPTFAGDTMTVNLTGVTDVQKITVTLSNVTDEFGQVLPDTPVSVNMLIGDTNADKRVNVGDTNHTKSKSGQMSQGNARNDVNLDARINVGDTNSVKAHSGHFIP